MPNCFNSANSGSSTALGGTPPNGVPAAAAAGTRSVAPAHPEPGSEGAECDTDGTADGASNFKPDLLVGDRPPDGKPAPDDLEPSFVPDDTPDITPKPAPDDAPNDDEDNVDPCVDEVDNDEDCGDDPAELVTGRLVVELSLSALVLLLFELLVELSLPELVELLLDELFVDPFFTESPLSVDVGLLLYATYATAAQATPATTIPPRFSNKLAFACALSLIQSIAHVSADKRAFVRKIDIFYYIQITGSVQVKHLPHRTITRLMIFITHQKRCAQRYL